MNLRDELIAEIWGKELPASCDAETVADFIMSLKPIQNILRIAEEAVYQWVKARSSHP